MSIRSLASKTCSGLTGNQGEKEGGAERDRESERDRGRQRETERDRERQRDRPRVILERLPLPQACVKARNPVAKEFARFLTNK